MSKFKKLNLDNDMREFFSSVIILTFFLVFVFISSFITPGNAYAACSLEKSKRCDTCYCPDPNDDAAVAEYCKYCNGNDQCNVCDTPTPPQEPPPSTECDKQPTIPEKAVCYAKSQLGKPYLLYAPAIPYDQWPPPEGAANYDCWGLVTWSYYWAGIKNLPKNTGPSTAIEVKDGSIKLGDILYWSDPFCGYVNGAHSALSLGGFNLIQEGGNYPDVHYSTFFDVGECPPDRVFRPAK
ncbi:MAG: NlpC/P60 family protein [bacterium]|nr:NlpC/P60 family protein [bacterium]